MDRGAWQATVHGVTKSQTQLSDSKQQLETYTPGSNTLAPRVTGSSHLRK